MARRSRAARLKTGGGANERAERVKLASLPPASWNQIVSWLRQIGALRETT